MAYKHKKQTSVDEMVLKCTDSEGQVAHITIGRVKAWRRNFAMIGSFDPAEKGAAPFFSCIKSWDIQNEKGKPLPLTIENFVDLDETLIEDFITQCSDSGFLNSNSTQASVTESE